MERAESSDDLYARADFITVHLPVTARPRTGSTPRRSPTMKDGVRVINVARGKLMGRGALRAALDSGKVAGAALDVFREEPATENPLFGYPNVVVTPHLGASTTEATDRAGYQAAEQVVAALTGGVVTSAVNVPAIAPEDLEALGPFLPLAHDLGRIASALAERTSVDAVEVEYLGRIAERDTRLLTVQVLKGVLGGHIEEEVNDVNAPAIAEERGIAVSETSSSHARDFTDLVRVTVVSGGERTRVVGHDARPAPPPASARGVGLALQPPARAAPRDLPLRGPAGDARPGRHRARRIAASTSSRPRWAASPRPGRRAMIVTADSPVRSDVVDGIVAGDGFVAGRVVSL